MSTSKPQQCRLISWTDVDWVSSCGLSSFFVVLCDYLNNQTLVWLYFTFLCFAAQQQYTSCGITTTLSCGVSKERWSSAPQLSCGVVLSVTTGGRPVVTQVVYHLWNRWSTTSCAAGGVQTPAALLLHCNPQGSCGLWSTISCICSRCNLLHLVWYLNHNRRLWCMKCSSTCFSPPHFTSLCFAGLRPAVHYN